VDVDDNRYKEGGTTLIDFSISRPLTKYYYTWTFTTKLTGLVVSLHVPRPTPPSLRPLTSTRRITPLHLTSYFKLHIHPSCEYRVDHTHSSSPTCLPLLYHPRLTTLPPPHPRDMAPTELGGFDEAKAAALLAPISVSCPLSSPNEPSLTRTAIHVGMPVLECRP
jgi:hypothetical protein